MIGENAMKDSKLIQKVHSGNKEAVGIIIERYYADIYRFCLYMVQTEDDAYDIAQETFLKFMKYGTSYKHHNLKGYLLTIARNICFNYFRDKKEKVTAIEWEEIDKIPNNKDMLTEAEDAVYLRNLLKELSQDTREVIILRIYEEMKFKDILLSTHIVSDIDYIADRILIMKNGELIQEGTEKEITDKVEGCVWKCIVSEKEAGQITSSFIVSNMRSSGENVELRIVSERQPVAGAENVESTLEDAYLYLTQIAGGEKNATL